MSRSRGTESEPTPSTSECPRDDAPDAPNSLLVRVDEAAAITGLPASLIRKSFIDEQKRPANIPAPPPHKRIGRSVYIIREKLADWVSSLGQQSAEMNDGRLRRGRPTVAQRMAKRASNDDTSLLPAIERASGKTRS